MLRYAVSVVLLVEGSLEDYPAARRHEVQVDIALIAGLPAERMAVSFEPASVRITARAEARCDSLVGDACQDERDDARWLAERLSVLTNATRSSELLGLNVTRAPATVAVQSWFSNAPPAVPPTRSDILASAINVWQSAGSGVDLLYAWVYALPMLLLVCCCCVLCLCRRHKQGARLLRYCVYRRSARSRAHRRGGSHGVRGRGHGAGNRNVDVSMVRSRTPSGMLPQEASPVPRPDPDADAEDTIQYI